MDKKDLNIVIVDDSKVSYISLKTMLKSIGFENITYFNYPIDYIKYLNHSSQDDVDIVFIDYQMPEMDGLEVLKYTKSKFPDIIAVMMTGSTDTEVKEKAIDFGVNEFMQKGIDFFDFQAKVNILTNLRFYYYETIKHQKELEVVLKYKDSQEILAVQKQLKIIEDRVSHHYYDNWLADSCFRPKDILSGDSYSTLQIQKDRFFISIVDGMGKGVSASLSSVLTVSFMNHSISKSLEFNDYKFERVVKDTFNYAASIMLDGEALSFYMIDIDLKNNIISYANIGMPPIYLLKDNEIIKLKANNNPLLSHSKKCQIDRYEGEFDVILAASDGLYESGDENDIPYFVNFRKKFKDFYLLNDLIKDFRKTVKEIDDDTTIFFMRKEKQDYKIRFKQDVMLTQNKIQNVVDNFEKNLEGLSQIVKDKIIFSLNELLINCYEHSVLKISENKHKIIQKDEKIEYNGEEKFAFLSILESDDYVVLHLSDEGQGFDISQILKSEWFNKYHGRGIKMLKKLSDGMYYNQKGNSVKLYFKKEQ